MIFLKDLSAPVRARREIPRDERLSEKSQRGEGL